MICDCDFVFRFDLYFRKNPFGGEYTVFAGLEECIRFIANFRLNEEEIDFIRKSLSTSCEVSRNRVPHHSYNILVKLIVTVAGRGLIKTRVSNKSFRLS